MSAASAEAGKVAEALRIVLGQSSVEDGRELPSHDFLADLDAMPIDEFVATPNNQCKKFTRLNGRQLTERLIRFCFWLLLPFFVL